MLPKQHATVRGWPLVLEVAQTPGERRLGLARRRQVPDGTGMLFVFPREGFHSFWMKDTYVPLMVYWLDITGTVVDYTGMLLGDLRSYVPGVAASFAVEVPLTWHAQHRVGYGDRFLFV